MVRHDLRRYINQQRRNDLLMEKVGLSQRKERRRKSRTKNWFLFSSVHGQAGRRLNYFGDSLPSYLHVCLADWLINEMPQGGEPALLIDHV